MHPIPIEVPALPVADGPLEGQIHSCSPSWQPTRADEYFLPTTPGILERFKSFVEDQREQREQEIETWTRNWIKHILGPEFPFLEVDAHEVSAKLKEAGYLFRLLENPDGEKHFCLLKSVTDGRYTIHAKISIAPRR